jgi:hypothetical protein
MSRGPLARACLGNSLRSRIRRVPTLRCRQRVGPCRAPRVNAFATGALCCAAINARPNIGSECGEATGAFNKDSGSGRLLEYVSGEHGGTRLIPPSKSCLSEFLRSAMRGGQFVATRWFQCRCRGGVPTAFR